MEKNEHSEEILEYINDEKYELPCIGEAAARSWNINQAIEMKFKLVLQDGLLVGL